MTVVATEVSETAGAGASSPARVQQVARQVFVAHRGEWITHEGVGNAVAVAFWRSAIAIAFS